MVLAGGVKESNIGILRWTSTRFETWRRSSRQPSMLIRSVRNLVICFQGSSILAVYLGKYTLHNLGALRKDSVGASGGGEVPNDTLSRKGYLPSTGNIDNGTPAPSVMSRHWCDRLPRRSITEWRDALGTKVRTQSERGTLRALESHLRQRST